MKKLITILLLITSIVSPLVVRAETELISEQPAVTYTAKETEAFAILDILNIFIKDDESIHSNVTRGEFTQIMLQFAGMSQLEIANLEPELRFPDILNSEYKTAISTACEKGYVVGYDDGFFYPEKYITLNEAVTIIDNVLGYNAFEELKFSNYDLYDNVTTGSNGVINYRAMGMLLFNALNSKVVSLDTTNYKTYTYGETALYTFHNVKVDNGIVKSNDVTSIDKIAGCSKGFVKIDDKLYNDPSDLAFDYLGYNVKAYYNVNESNTSDDDEIIYITQGRNKVLEVQAEDVLDNTNIRKFYYIENDKEKSFDIPLISVINNFTLALRHTEEMLKPDNGYLVWIDNDYDGTYDVLLVYSYSDTYVSSVDADNGIIYDVYGINNISVADKDCTILMDNKEIEIKDVPVGSIVTGYVSDNYARLLVSDKIVSGKITALAVDTDDRSVTLDGAEYKTGYAYEQALLATKATQLDIGTSGKIYLNVFGDIVAYVKSTGDINYGYALRAFGLEDEETGDIKPIVELVDSTGVKKQYPLSTKNGRYYYGLTETRIKNMTIEAIKIAFDTPQVVKYKLNKDNEITKIYLSDGSIVSSSIDINESERLALNFSSPTTGSSYSAETSKHIDNDWLCLPQTIIFDVPVDESNNLVEGGNIKIISYDKIRQGSYRMEVYDASQSKIPAVAVIYNANKIPGLAPTYYGYYNYVVTKDVYTSINKDEEVVTVLEGYYLGKLTTYETTDPTLFADFSKGDVGQIALYDGKPFAARVLYYDEDVDLENWSDTEMTYRNTLHKRDSLATGNAIYTNKTSQTLVVHANVFETSSNFLSVHYRRDELDTNSPGYQGVVVQTYPITSNPAIYKVTNDRTGLSVEMIKISELRTSSDLGVYNGSRVLLNVRGGRIDEIFVLD